MSEWIITEWDDNNGDRYFTDDPFSAIITRLNSNQIYEYQAQAENNDGEGEWSSSEYFTTLQVVGPFPSYFVQ